MEPQLFDMLQARFDKLDEGQARMVDTFEKHTEMDQKYWQKIDAQEAQISLLKWLTGTVGGSGLLAWLYQVFGKH